MFTFADGSAAAKRSSNGMVRVCVWQKCESVVIRWKSNVKQTKNTDSDQELYNTGSLVAAKKTQTTATVI